MALLAWMAVAANPLSSTRSSSGSTCRRWRCWRRGPRWWRLPCRRGLAQAGGRGGALAGAGVLLRPEGAWYAAGLALALGPRWWLSFGSGAAALLLPAAAVNYGHFGNPLGAHASRGARTHRRRLRGRPVAAHPGLAVAGLGRRSGGTGSWPRRGSRRRATDVRARQSSRSRASPWWRCSRHAGAAVQIVLAGIPAGAAGAGARGRVAPASERLAGARRRDGDGRRAHRHQRRRRAVGHRYLLVAAPPLLLLAARGGTDAARAGRGGRRGLGHACRDSAGGRRHQPQRLSRLRGAKRSYDGLVAAAASFTPPGGVIVTNAVVARPGGGDAASHADVSYTRTRPPPPRARQIRANASTPYARVIGRRAESPFPLDAALDGTCFRRRIRDTDPPSIRFATTEPAAE